MVAIALYQPDIPQNTGNVLRLGACLGVAVHLIGPAGFDMADRRFKRAGMDYWQHVEWQRWKSWTDFHASLPAGARLWFIESDGPRRYTEARFEPEDFLVFGRETAGLPKTLLEQHRDRWLCIPMFHSEARSLNLSNCVALVLYEALRQQGFAGEI